ncbi:MAG: NAD(P)/FAD-dependent oxidoreductase [Actinomycetota bacterium]|nr:NAD(P)/FAD-dependent oxidoreductase [Actinomycetota bacterium]
MTERPIILGGGPAGLTAAYLLAHQGRAPLVLEALPQVGGLSRTEVRDGYRFDIGGHRFFTKSAEVERLWHEILGDQFLLRPRLSRIYYRGRFIDYPLRGADLVRKLGVPELMRVTASYVAAVTRRSRPDETFEDWVSQRFGRRLYEMFFRSYTEKVWGVPCTELRAEWAAQRIRGLSFASAARAAAFGGGGSRVRSLIEEFHYPRLGPGQMWEAMAEEIESAGGEVRTGAPVQRLRIEDERVVEVQSDRGSVAAGPVISSLPLRTMVGLAVPGPPPEVVEAAAGLRYRDFICVALVLEGEDLFPDNWIYVHDPAVLVARVQNFAAWSPWMIPEAGRSCVGMEYFCFEGDDLWSRSDDELVELATAEFSSVGLGDRGRVLAGHVVRVPKAYPIYDESFAWRVEVIRGWLQGLSGFQQIGRNGLHRYNNADHSMLTAMRAVENLDGADHDVWAVNADSWYHESESPDEYPYRGTPRPPDNTPVLDGV